MYNHRIFLLLLAGYVLTPTLFSWVVSSQGVWYKPFVLWVLVIIGAYLLQKINRQNNDL